MRRLSCPKHSRHLTRTLSSSSFSNHKIKACVREGQYLEALYLYSRNPQAATNYTYPSLLKACASLSIIHYGKALHSTLLTYGLYSDPFITSSLINMYVKCGSLTDAVNLFDKFPACHVSLHDVTVWNSIIGGFFRFGHFREGILEFRRMQTLGVRPDAYSLCTLLGECGSILEGKQIHGFIVRNMPSVDPFLETAVISMYFDCGRPMDAWRFFVKLKQKNNVVSWNIMIRGFCEISLWEHGLELYVWAKNENVKLVSGSFSSTLIACCQGELLTLGQQVHSDVVKMGFENDTFVSNSLLSMYGRCTLVEDAEKVFHQASDKEIGSWNAMVSAYVYNGLVCDAFKIYKHMRSCEILPDSFTLSNILPCCSGVGLYDFGRLIHTDLVKRPVPIDIAAVTALLIMYSKNGSIDEAISIFNTMEDRDVVAWGSIISGFCQNGEYEEAIHFFKEMEAEGLKPDSSIIASMISAFTGMENVDLGCIIHGFVIKSGLNLDVFVASSLIDMYSKSGFQENAQNVFSDMPYKNLVAWNSIISCHCRNGLPELSISLFSQIMEHGLHPDSVSITTILVAISSVAALIKGKAVHAYLTRLNISLDLQTENKLIDMYLKCGFMKYAQRIFQTMAKKDLVTWNSIIAGHGSHGECLKAMRKFEEMKSCGIRPDDVTFISLLSSCNHSGFVEEGLFLFQSMITDYGIEPRMEHYANVVDLLGRAGCLDDAYSFVDKMPFEPDSSIWLSLLCSSRVHRDVELGELAAGKLLKIEPSRSSNYIQLLNIYGEAELWDRTVNLLASMREKRLKKIPGCSWIELRNTMHVFFSGDCSSTSEDEIFEVVISLKMNMVIRSDNFETVEAF
ncbi:hypothetical protein K2173_005021 [Erythroxylum novogranatense]|uniref:Uncharacterized protein n=1 Tax=Erythroxylum novogranatense TaxID=1862640 RepID=A0AAV8TCM2_9ROSI|nr:hypothetical protein K2173_005021 [Erythroxylum novogranatense]